MDAHQHTNFGFVFTLVTITSELPNQIGSTNVDSSIFVQVEFTDSSWVKTLEFNQNVLYQFPRHFNCVLPGFCAIAWEELE